MFAYIWLILLGLFELVGWTTCVLDFVATCQLNNAYKRMRTETRATTDEFTQGWFTFHVIVITALIFLMSIFEYFGVGV